MAGEQHGRGMLCVNWPLVCQRNRLLLSCIHKGKRQTWLGDKSEGAVAHFYLNVRWSSLIVSTPEIIILTHYNINTFQKWLTKTSHCLKHICNKCNSFDGRKLSYNIQHQMLWSNGGIIANMCPEKLSKPSRNCYKL